MLGRLRMSLEDCEDAYLKLSQDIFTPRRSKFAFLSKFADFLQANGRFDAEVLENTIKDCIESVAGQDDSLMDKEEVLKDPNSACRV
jgi:hypothetical protein